MADPGPVSAALNTYTRAVAAELAAKDKRIADLEAQVGGGGTPPTDPPPAGGGAWVDTLRAVGGCTHAYPLDPETQARDVVGNAHGTVKGSGVTFSADGAVFTGRGYIELPDSDDFSVATRQGLTIVATVAITDWRGVGSSEYIHWMGKGVSGAHEWVFRHYVKGGSGEAGQRQGRVSFYHFNPSGGLGAGSYFQDSMETGARHIAATADMRQVQIYRDGRHRDTDPLSGYNVTPRNTGTPVRIGTRDMGSYLVGRVSQVAFFNRVLSGSEIARIASA